jgi:transposase-like protein
MARIYPRAFKAEVLSTLIENNGNVTATAKQCKVSRPTLRLWIKEAETERAALMAQLADTFPDSSDSVDNGTYSPSSSALPTLEKVESLYIESERLALERAIASIPTIEVKNASDIRNLLLSAGIST